MIATVRLDSELEEILNSITKKFHKKKSDIIREAIKHYAKHIEISQKTRLQIAMGKTMKSDFKEYQNFESSIDDSL